MKNILKTVIVIAIPLMMGMTVFNAQAQKFGHINSNELLSLMPERKKATAEVEKFAKQLENQLKTMSAEYDSKLQDYQSKEGIMTEPIKQIRLKELLDLEQRIRDFQLTAQQSLQKKETELLTPLIDKAKNAIEEVAKKNGYTYIFDTSVGFILYFQEGDDIMSLVKKKLGL